MGGAAGVPGPAIIPVGYEAVSGFSADERSASATFVKWSKHLQQKRRRPGHLEDLPAPGRGDSLRPGTLGTVGVPDSGVVIPQSTLDAIAAKNAKGA